MCNLCSVMGIFNAMWLIFVYKTAPTKKDTQDIDDPVVEISIAHVPSGSWQHFLAVVAASYVFFGYAMYLVWQEFAWYTRMRHEFLRHELPRNYAVLIRNIPEIYRNNMALEQFMSSCFSVDAVLEARVAVTTSQLAATQQQRSTVLARLEHAWAQWEKTGRRPTHRDGFCGNKTDSIETYQGELDALNDKVETQMTEIENKIAASLKPASDWNQVRHVVRAGLTNGLTNSQSSADQEASDEARMLLEPGAIEQTGNEESPKNEGTESSVTDNFGGAGQFATDVAAQFGDALSNVGSVATGAVGEAASMIVAKQDGERHPTGFVVFAKLSTKNEALQTVHHATPFALEIVDAPDPKDSKCLLDIGCTFAISKPNGYLF